MQGRIYRDASGDIARRDICIPAWVRCLGRWAVINSDTPRANMARLV